VTIGEERSLPQQQIGGLQDLQPGAGGIHTEISRPEISPNWGSFMAHPWHQNSWVKTVKMDGLIP